MRNFVDTKIVEIKRFPFLEKHIKMGSQDGWVILIRTTQIIEKFTIFGQHTQYFGDAITDPRQTNTRHDKP